MSPIIGFSLSLIFLFFPTLSLALNSYGFEDVKIHLPLDSSRHLAHHSLANSDISGVLILLKPTTPTRKVGPTQSIDAQFKNQSHQVKQDDAFAVLTSRFSAEGFLVIEVDPSKFDQKVTHSTVNSGTNSKRQCTEFSDCLVALSAYVQTQNKLSTNFLPTLISWQDAGIYAETSWRQAPQSTFHTVITVDYCPKQKRLPFLFNEKHSQWSVINTAKTDIACSDLVYRGPHTFKLNQKTIPSDPFSQPDPLVQWVKSHVLNIENYKNRLPTAIQKPSSELNIDDLQTVLVEPKKSGKFNTFAVLYSGDGGWAEFTDELAAELNQKQIPVVGINSMRYFWREKSPEQGAEDLARIIKFYQKKWQARSAHLIGFSFGAGALPFFIRRLTPEVQKNIGRVTLLAPFRRADFKFHISDWLFDDDRGKEVMAEIRLLNPRLKPDCIYPSDEKKVSLCTQSNDAPLTSIELSGGHHFKGKINEVIDVVLNDRSSSSRRGEK